MTDGGPFTPEIREAIELEWAALQAAHPGLERWTLKLSFDAAWWNPHGCSYFPTNIIVLYRSRMRDDLALAEYIDTLRHEAAHALRGAPNHDGQWRRLAVELGATPRACR